MKTRWIALALITAAFGFAGCATTDSELTQKEKDKMARDAERENQRQQKAEERMMRGTTGGGTGTRTR